MTSRIDRAFIRAFAKQRGESTAKPESAEAAAPEPTRVVSRRVDAPEETPAKPFSIVWQELPASVSTATAAFEARGLEDLGSLEVMPFGEAFPTELYEADLTRETDTGEKAAVVPALSPESVRRRLDEAEPVATPHLDLPEANGADDPEPSEVVVDEVFPAGTVTQALLDVFKSAEAEEAEEAEAEAEAAEATDQPPLDERAETDDQIGDQIGEAAGEEASSLLHIKGPFVPAWEADEIQWPRMVERLHHLDDRFEAAGRQLAQAAREGLRTLAVTSTYRGEGRTTIAMNLARSASSAGIRVALVDGDVDNPALASSAGIAAAHGWHECLAGGLPLDEAAVTSIGDGVTLLPLTSAVRRASVAATGPAFASMVEALSLHFDLIIVDYGPLGERPSPIVGDAAMLVRDIRCTSAEQALTAVRKIRELGPRSVGVVQNFT